MKPYIVLGWNRGKRGTGEMNCGCDVILNDYERVRLFDGVLFEHHAYVTDPRAFLLEKLSRDFECGIVSGEEFCRRHGLGRGQLGYVRCVRR